MLDAAATAPPPLSTDEALAVLEPYFEAARKRFLDKKMSRIERVRLECADWIHDSPRHFAATEDSGLLVLVSPLLAGLPEETVTGILVHELGHATDFLYPGEFTVTDEGELQRLRDITENGKYQRKARLTRMTLWNKRDNDTVERTADAIGNEFAGVKIGYGGPCMLQSVAGGRRPRPEGLR